MNTPPAQAGTLSSQANRVGERILWVIWIGSIWTIGYIVAPALFAELPDRALAGAMAGRLFTIEAWLTMICGGLLWLMSVRGKEQAPRHRVGRRLIPVMMLLTAGNEWLLRPIMAASRDDPARFGMLHGASALLFMAVALLGLFLISLSDAPVNAQ